MARCADEAFVGRGTLACSVRATPDLPV